MPVWQGKPLYRSYLITGRDRAAQSLDDLKGDVHAFSDPDSNSGWLVTATALAKRNHTPDRFFGQTLFTWGHRNVVRAVASGLATSGSVDGYVYEVMRETEPELIGRTRVVSQSELLGFPPIACAATPCERPSHKAVPKGPRRNERRRRGQDGPADAPARRLQRRGLEPVRQHCGGSFGRSRERRMSALRLPLSIKMPLVVTIFMAAVAIFVTERVLSRLEETQTRHLHDLATVYLDGLASALTDPVVRDDVWEVFDILDRARQTHAGMKPTETVVASADGRVLASSDPRSTPPWSRLPANFLPGHAATRSGGDPRKRWHRRRATRPRLGRSNRRIRACDLRYCAAARRTTLGAGDAPRHERGAHVGLCADCVAHGYTHDATDPRADTTSAGLGAEHQVSPIPDRTVDRAPGEFRNLFGAFNELAAAVRDREVLSRQLAEEERLASLGRLASGMAHEINNPLGGLFNALDTLKEHGGRTDVRGRTIDLVERGLRGIRDVVRAALVTYRVDGETNVPTVRLTSRT